MSTDAKYVEFHRQLKLLEIHKKEPAKSKLRPRDLIKIRMRCRLCGRARAVYRKFGLCRICFRNQALDGLIPGVQKASW
jgi:small subunit ribosomal protein S14